jgi:glycosyltransferase involved in cell wall biosynthesis
LAYTTYEPLTLITGFLLRFFGFLWIADIWDDPKLTLENAKKSLNPWRVSILYHLLVFAIAKPIIKYAHCVLLSLLPDALSEYKIDTSKLVLITNGVDLDMIKPIANITKRNFFSIFYVGHVNKIRGIDTVLSSASHLIRKDINKFKIILAGYATKKEKVWLLSEIKRLKLEENIDFLGELPHSKVLEEIAKADMCLFPFPRTKELDYIYPIKIFEYMAMGKAVVASELKGVASIISNGKNGLLFEPGNDSELCNAIMTLYNNIEKRKEIEKNAVKRSSLYSWVKVNQTIGKTINSLHY